MKKIITLFILFIPLIYFSQYSWEWVHPRPTGNTLLGIYFLNGDEGFIVGKRGTIIKTNDGGANFLFQTSPSIRNIQAVKFSSATLGVAVGENGLILRTSTAGSRWDSVRPPTGVTQTLYSVSSPPANPSVFYAVGGDGIFLKSTNSGGFWQRIVIPGITTTLYGVYFPENQDIGYICGANGLIYKTTDGGTSWQSLSTGTTVEFRDIYFLDNNLGFACGQYGQVWKTTDGGTTFSLGPAGTAEDLKAIRFANNNLGIAVGNNGTIVRTTNGGANWQVINSGVNFHLYGIAFISPNVYVIGDGGTILKSTDNGETWTLLTRRIKNEHLRGLHCPDNNLCFAVGANGAGLKTTDGGNTWQSMFMDWPYNVNDLFFFDNNFGLGVGNKGYYATTTNSGALWVRTAVPPDTIEKFSIHGAGGVALTVGRAGSVVKYSGGWQALQRPAANDLYGVYMINSSTAWICGSDGYIARTDNGGNSWSRQTTGISQTLFSIYFVNDNLGFACGENGVILKTTNGGSSWTQLSSGVNVPLYAIGFANENYGWVVGSGGYILRTTNGGGTWLIERPITSFDLYDICVRDTSPNIYAVGLYSTVIKRSAVLGIAENSSKEINKKIITNLISKEKFYSQIANSEIKIYDVKGRLIDSKKIKSGIYFIETKKKREKLIIH